MHIRKVHKTIGLLLAIPLLGWALTGIVFLTKPGYGSAYEQIEIKTYPLERSFDLAPFGNWHEARLLRSVVGYHLLLRESNRWLHLDPRSGQQRAAPSDADLRRLVADAIGHNPGRYGEIVAASHGSVTTSTGVQITLDWNNLSLAQAGHDTRFINLLYRIHYLQWMGHPLPNTLFGITGIVLLLSLTGLGLAGFFQSRRK